MEGTIEYLKEDVALICCIAMDSVFELINISAESTLLLTDGKLAAFILAYALTTLVERIAKAVGLKIYNIGISYLVSNMHIRYTLLTKR